MFKHKGIAYFYEGGLLTTHTKTCLWKPTHPKRQFDQGCVAGLIKRYAFLKGP